MGSFYRSQQELVLVFRKGTASHRNNIQLGQFGRNRTNVWQYPGSRTTILKAIARARFWYKQITTGEAQSITQPAGVLGVSARFIRMQMNLVLLSPRSIERMIACAEALPLSLDDLLVSIPMN